MSKPETFCSRPAQGKLSGERIKHLRLNTGMSLSTFCRIVGITANYQLRMEQQIEPRTGAVLNALFLLMDSVDRTEGAPGALRIFFCLVANEVSAARRSGLCRGDLLRIFMDRHHARYSKEAAKILGLPPSSVAKWKPGSVTADLDPACCLLAAHSIAFNSEAKGERPRKKSRNKIGAVAIARNRPDFPVNLAT